MEYVHSRSSLFCEVTPACFRQVTFSFQTVFFHRPHVFLIYYLGLFYQHSCLPIDIFRLSAAFLIPSEKIGLSVDPFFPVTPSPS